MSLLENISGQTASTDTEQTSDFAELVEQYAPDPDHTMKFVENSGWVDKGKVADILTAISEGNKDTIVGKYEGYRSIIDLQRVIGGSVDKSASYNFYDADGDIDKVAEGSELSDFTPVDGQILTPLFAWNMKRKHAAQEELEDTPGNLPAYRAIFPEPQIDGYVMWSEENIDPSASDSHIWVQQDFMDTFEGEIPPETVEGSDSETIAICGRAKDDGEPCRTPVKFYGESCQHHDGEQLATEVDKDTRELVDSAKDTPEEDTTEKAESDADTDESASRNMTDFKECLEMADGDMDKAKEIYELTH